MSETCKDCRHNFAHECRRFPPLRTEVGWVGGNRHLYPKWPEIGDQHWCGEFSPKAPGERDTHPLNNEHTGIFPMEREALRKFWLDTDPAIICRMIDGEFAILIIGPSDLAISHGDWKFGFQVRGEEEIRWRQPEQLERQGNALIEINPASTNTPAR
jgi:hypothetical protein